MLRDSRYTKCLRGTPCVLGIITTDNRWGTRYENATRNFSCHFKAFFLLDFWFRLPATPIFWSLWTLYVFRAFWDSLAFEYMSVPFIEFSTFECPSYQPSLSLVWILAFLSPLSESWLQILSSSLESRSYWLLSQVPNCILAWLIFRGPL